MRPLRDYCGTPTPNAIRSYQGQGCVLSTGHRSLHRAMDGTTWSDDDHPHHETCDMGEDCTC